MSILLSSNMLLSERFPETLEYVRKLDGRIGVEVFPTFDNPAFEPALKASLPFLKTLETSFHEPYYHTDHTDPEGTPRYEATMRMERQTAHYAGLLNSRYVVFHHNNIRVPEDDPSEVRRMQEESCRNFRRVEALFAAEGIPVLTENVGVLSRGNVLFTQEEFTELCIRENYRVLIDIGHANANGWDLFRLMRDLKDRIAAYHLHNNDGVHDSHQRIHNGTLDFEKFLDVWRENGVRTDWVLEYVETVAPDREGVLEDLKYLLKEYHF